MLIVDQINPNFYFEAVYCIIYWCTDTEFVVFIKFNMIYHISIIYLSFIIYLSLPIYHSLMVTICHLPISLKEQPYNQTFNLKYERRWF